jgi:hypothetical protein
VGGKREELHGCIDPRSPVTLDPAGTWLKNAQGQKLKLRIENGSLAFE